MEKKEIKIFGAKEHNLKNIDVTIPKNSLTIITGLSGSGKSSLAFSTLYAEGERRYVESLSTFTRQFFKTKEKPDVDDIEGLSPAIAIDQKGQSHNPRSTVATSTEVHDYLRILFANRGIAYCLNGHGPIIAENMNSIIKKINNELNEGETFYICAPMARNRKKNLNKVIEKAKEDGYVRVLVNNQVCLLDDEITFDNNLEYNIDALVSRYVYNEKVDIDESLTMAVESSLEYSDGLVKFMKPETEEFKIFSIRHACKECDFIIPKIEPSLFSFNQKKGACSSCSGIGSKLEADENLLVPDKSLSLNEGAISYYKSKIDENKREYLILKALCNEYNISMNLPYEKLTRDQRNIILRGSDKPIKVSYSTSAVLEKVEYDYIEGIATKVERKYVETTSDFAGTYYASFMIQKICNKCKGKRLNDFALSIKINGMTIADVVELPIEKSLELFININITKNEDKVNNLILTKIIEKLSFMDEIGLGYIKLDRQTSTLSGGEAQRIKLAKQLGSKLTGVLYVLDEPSIGLHQKDNNKLINILKRLRDLGNTVVVVEHDTETIESSDWIIDIGPEPGIKGGYLVAEGTPDEIKKNPNSITGQYLSGKKIIPLPKERRKGKGNIEVIGARENNLKNIDVSIPLESFTCVTGVSGGGKSTLLEDILYKGITELKGLKISQPGQFQQIKNSEAINKVIYISQEPIGRSPRSVPATYIGVFDDIREIFASSPESKIRGYLKGRFSFNKPGGRCETCGGEGEIRVDMQFIGSVVVECDQCNGKRYNESTLAVKYKNKNIYDVLNMTFDEAYLYFENMPKINEKIETIIKVGLGYLKLGQSAATLSGGEAQRVKLSTFLLKKSKGKNLLLFDEPTTGLHIHDVRNLIEIFQQLVENKNTIVVIEHNLDFIKVADYIIDMGLDGGEKGGYVVASGTPEEVSENIKSYTGQYIKSYLK